MQQDHEPVMSRVRLTYDANEAWNLELMVSSLLLEVLKSELHTSRSCDCKNIHLHQKQKKDKKLILKKKTNRFVYSF